MKIQNESGLIPIKSNGVLVYIGDTEFFSRKITQDSSFLIPTDESITRAISDATEGIVIEKGKQAFGEGFDYKCDLGTKVSFKGHYGHTYSEKKGYYKSGNAELINRAYYRILKDSDIEAICTTK